MGPMPRLVVRERDHAILNLQARHLSHDGAQGNSVGGEHVSADSVLRQHRQERLHVWANFTEEGRSKGPEVTVGTALFTNRRRKVKKAGGYYATVEGGRSR